MRKASSNRHKTNFLLDTHILLHKDVLRKAHRLVYECSKTHTILSLSIPAFSKTTRLICEAQQLLVLRYDSTKYDFNANYLWCTFSRKQLRQFNMHFGLLSLSFLAARTKHGRHLGIHFAATITRRCFLSLQ